MARVPTLIVIGGVPGAGKSTVARRLAANLGLPLLSSDRIGQIVRASRGVRAQAAVDAHWVAYEVVFGVGEEFLAIGLSVVLDLNLGWPFQWQWLDAVRARRPGVQVLPIVLRCSRDVCLERIRQRHVDQPATDRPERYRDDPKILAVFSFLEQFERPDVVAIDASRRADEVYAVVEQAALAAMGPTTDGRDE